jgi:hypothetical protein
MMEGLYFVACLTGLSWPNTGKDDEDYDMQTRTMLGTVHFLGYV